MCQDRTDDMLETHFTCKGKKYPVIGLTGGVGAGKSTVLSILQEKYGFHVIQADLVARALMEPGKEAYEAVCAFLGPKILLEDGQINRSAMAEIIFKDPSKRAKVDSLTHPLVWKAVKKEAEEYNRQSVVIEAAIPSKEFRDICDEMWYLYTSREERIRRLKESRGYSDEKGSWQIRHRKKNSETLQTVRSTTAERKKKLLYRYRNFFAGRITKQHENGKHSKRQQRQLHLHRF